MFVFENPFRTSHYFNSTIVRLRPWASHAGGTVRDKFQFYNSAIKTLFAKFTFHCLLPFQFYNSAIKTFQNFWLWCRFDNFNSTIVRLRLSTDSVDFVVYNKFQFYNSAIKTFPKMMFTYEDIIISILQ